MSRQRNILLAAALLLVAAMLPGCGHKLTGSPKPDQAPQTTIFVQGPVDSVNHIAHLFWYGTDADGYVVGYEVRLVNPADPDTTHAQWHFTTRTDSLFVVYSPEGGAEPTLYVRAIDNQGMPDPDPAVQVFKFRNHAPVARFTVSPNRTDFSDTTFASVTVTWSLTDPDGDPTRTRYRVWLDPAPGDAIDYAITDQTTFTMPSSKFTMTSAYSTRRTLHVQAIDDGGMAGPIDSVSWNVRRPVMGSRARVLVIDDTYASDPGHARNDSLFINAVLRLGAVQPDQMAFIWLATSQPFKSAADVEQTLKLFETVIWFRGYTASSYSATLKNYFEGIGPYLDGGGRLYLESMSLASGPTTAGAFTPEFISRYANASGFFQHPALPESLGVWSLANRRVVRVPPLNDSLRTNIALGGIFNGTAYGLNGFITRNASQIFIVADKDTLAEGNPIPMGVALDVPQANGGRFIMSTYPLAAASAPATTQRASAVATGVMRMLGLDH